VDVDRDPNGDYFDPTKPGYKNPRYADVHFDYFNTRGACTIDRNALSRAMEEAFARALTRFGIENPNRGEIAKHVGDSINATRQQCTRNADKYVSNETFSSIDWGTGKAVGNLTAKAYAGVPTPDGGVQTVVARENSWPGADVSSLGDDASAKIRILSSRRVVAGGGDESAGNWGSSSEDSQKPTQPGPAPQTGWVTGSSSAKPTRYPSQREDYNPSASAFDLGAPAVPIAPPNNVFARDRQNSFGNRFGNWTTLPNASPSVVPSGDSFDSRFGNWTSSPAGIAPRNPNLPVPPPEPGMLHWIFSSKPMPLWTTPLPLGALPNNASASSNSGWFNFPAGPVLQNPTPSVSPPQA
jgi:hypothetical protein